MSEEAVLALWVLTALGGLTVLGLAVRPRRGQLPAHLGIPGPLVAAHVLLAIGGLAGWTALVLAADPDPEPPWLLPALAAVGAACLGIAMLWRGHLKPSSGAETAPTADPTDQAADRGAAPAAERPPAFVRYVHGALGVATAVGAVVVALA